MKKCLILIISLFLLVGCGKKETIISEKANGVMHQMNTNLEVTSNQSVTSEAVSTEPIEITSSTETTSTSTTMSLTSSTSKTTTKKSTSTTKKITTKKTTTTTKKTTTTTKKITTKTTVPIDLTEQKAYEILLSLKKDYPEGKAWDDNTWSDFHGGNYSGGWGCVGFTYMASDRVFGTLPVKRITDFSKIRVGDIFRYQSSSYGHSVIVLEVKSDRIVVVEGNWQKKVHWNREITFDFMKKYGKYIYTRWPE